MPRTTKRIFFGACTHCGHRVGLTPPAWQLQPGDLSPKRTKWLKIQKECWEWFRRRSSVYKPYDLAVWNGDLIDGTGHRSGGTELICTDRNEQMDMASKIVNTVKAKKNVFIHGTPYHSGEQEDMEDIIASYHNERGHDHEWLDVNGVIFDVKHFVGASSIPHGRLTGLAREELWNVLWHEAGYTPRADYVVRAHVHYTTGGWRMVGSREVAFFTLPALQAMGTKFGAKKCSGLVDFGFHVFQIDGKGNTTWQKEIAEIESQKALASKF